ncbi:cytidine deaminase [Alysiella filiformis]|uniref:Cytidine deaminase n=1 Tax=Alysiella filiformis DSM 16848 TaxID=1120981 RepID=A0A286E6C8_9NEIS|nr:cytidine deaminase [Alysiella filiformis]QMT31476.1 cytidine deaminase [Alysiella filiformis]UBQ55513.1 cytidine deaminase [Alysiella filiformis DSM 16848]SOD66439.1 cytidine deaminase [Alysiella filiformis DSM 16848]
MKLQSYFSHQDVLAFQAAHANHSDDLIDLAFSLLVNGIEQAVVPVSHFKVGACAIDDEGNFYFGANQECSHAAMGQTVHAEQSAIAHAWARGAKRITDIVVNYTPCGHCRQFLNELRGAEDLQIHLPHSRNNLLSQYLPDSFGPKDLDMTVRFLDAQNHGFSLPENGAQDDAVFQAALRELNRSYAPYSQAYAGVALRVESGEIFAGGYAENAAYNPTLPPLQVALNLLRLSGFHENQVREAVLICTEHGGHAAHTQALWSALSSVPLRILTLK